MSSTYHDIDVTDEAEQASEQYEMIDTLVDHALQTMTVATLLSLAHSHLLDEYYEKTDEQIKELYDSLTGYLGGPKP